MLYLERILHILLEEANIPEPSIIEEYAESFAGDGFTDLLHMNEKQIKSRLKRPGDKAAVIKLFQSKKAEKKRNKSSRQ